MWPGKACPRLERGPRNCDENEMQRLLDPRQASKLSRLEAVLAAFGQQLVVGVQVNREPVGR